MCFCSGWRSIGCARRRNVNPAYPMTYSFMHLNWLAVFGTAVIGFLLGWLWYSPLMFAKPWRTEMNITDEQIAAIAKQGMGRYLLLGFVYTLISTLALATLIRAHIPVNA